MAHRVSQRGTLVNFEGGAGGCYVSGNFSFKSDVYL